MMDRKSNGFRSKFEAFLGNHQQFGSYLNSYHDAFKILMKDIEMSSGHVDQIAYPMLFIARHCLELGFKTNIRYFKKYSERNDFTNSDSHNLKDLFYGFKLHVQLTIKNLREKHSIEVDSADIDEFEQYCSEIERLTRYFDQIDKGSFSFRYPVNKQNKYVFNLGERVNLLDVEELLSQGMKLLMKQPPYSKNIQIMLTK